MKVAHKLLVEDLGMLYPTKNSKRKHRYIIARCDTCSKERKVMWNTLQGGKSINCTVCSKLKHGNARKGRMSKLYNVLLSMRQRCNNPNNSSYKNYGFRGISVCEEWLTDFSSFSLWAVSAGYKEGLQIDRINNDKGYSPDNCRWVTAQVNNLNRRNRKSKHKYRGVSDGGALNPFRSSLTLNKDTTHLGLFKTPKEAAEAYDKHIKKNGLPNTLNTEEESDELT